MNYYMGIKDIKFKKYGLKTTAMKSVFWPCYRLAVSVESRDEIDPFAKVVLQMANCGITDTDELVEELCLNPDFVKLASSYGIDAVRVDTLDDLKLLCEKNLTGPLVVEVVVESEDVPLPK